MTTAESVWIRRQMDKRVSRLMERCLGCNHSRADHDEDKCWHVGMEERYVCRCKGFSQDLRRRSVRILEGVAFAILVVAVIAWLMWGGR